MKTIENVTKYWMERNSGITIKCKKKELPNKINPEYICHCDWIEMIDRVATNARKKEGKK